MEETLRMDILAVAALFVTMVGMIFLLGFLSTNAGAEWGTVETNMASLVVLVALAVVCVAFALKKVL